MNDETRLTPGDTTRLTQGDNTRLTPGDTTRKVDDETANIEEATVMPARPLDDLSEVSVRLRAPVERVETPWPLILVPGGESFSLHRAIAVGRRPVTPLTPTERILLLTWDPEDGEVSSTHLLLEPTERGVAITDLGSTNGTRVTERGRKERRLGPRQSCLVSGEATVEFGREGKLVVVPA